MSIPEMSSNSEYPPPHSAISPAPGPYSPNFPQQGYTPPQNNELQEYPSSQGNPHPPGPQEPLIAPSFGFATQQRGFTPQQEGFAPQQGGYVPPEYVQPPYQPPPIVQQPGSMGPGPQQAGGGAWMNMPQGPENCPPGLEYLTLIDELLVYQKLEPLKVCTCDEKNNKYTIKNSVGQKVYHAVEDNDCLTRNCCGSIRPFEMKILDNYGNQVINMHRPLACNTCCFPCCLQSMEVSSPPGTVVGFVEQEWSLHKPLFVIKNAMGDIVLRIQGPICRIELCGDIEFKVLDNDGETRVGKISKKLSGIISKTFGDEDYFGITFPMDLDVRIKAVLLGALFLIDFLYLENLLQIIPIIIC